MNDFVDQSGNNPRVPNKEELILIRASILLPMMLSIAEKNRQEVERQSYSLKALFLKATVVFMDLVSMEMARVKRELKQRDIRVIEEDQTETTIYHRYFCRGYQERFGMMKEVVRAELGIQLGAYMGRVFNKS